MKKIATIALAASLTLVATLSARADLSNPRYPQDLTWDYNYQGANGGGGGGGGGD